jgi:hypothetical protein
MRMFECAAAAAANAGILQGGALQRGICVVDLL